MVWEAASLALLLKKYMMHVANHEGTSFLEDWRKTNEFTDEEWAALQVLDKDSFTKSEGASHANHG